jgi:hypothetical protein
MQNRPFRSLFPMLCIYCACALGLGGQTTQAPQQANSKEQMILEAIRGAKKSIYVVAPGPIAEPFFAELVIRQASRTIDNKTVALEVTTGDSELGTRFARMGIVTWASPRFANGAEVLVIDRSVVIKNFSSPKSPQAINDPALAKKQIKAIKKDRKSSEKIRGYGKKSKWWWVARILFFPYRD